MPCAQNLSEMEIDDDASPPPGADKPALRVWAQERRVRLDIAALSRALTERIRALPEFGAARDVLLYLAMPGEVNVDGLLEDAGAERRFYAPRCAPKRRLAAHRFLPGETPMQAGPFEIREPDPEKVAETDPGSLGLVIVPALLLSEAGDRLGYGGGYYDRFLPRLNAQCVRVSAVPDALVVPTLPVDPWDQPVHIIVTEKRVLRR